MLLRYLPQMAILAFSLWLCPVSTNPAIAADDLGVTKIWGPIEITLSKANVRGDTAIIELRLKNVGESNETFSSFESVRVLSTEGDIAGPDITTMCSGLMPPSGRLKCKLEYVFDTSPTGLAVQILDDAMSSLVQKREKRQPIFFNTNKIKD